MLRGVGIYAVVLLVCCTFLSRYATEILREIADT